MSTVEGAGVELAYEERGARRRRCARARHGRRRTRADAGRSGPRRARARDRLRPPRLRRRAARPSPTRRTTVQEQAEDARRAAAVAGAARRARWRARLRRAVALDLLLRHPALAARRRARDPPLLAFVPDAARAWPRSARSWRTRCARAGPGRRRERGSAAADGERVARAQRSAGRSSPTTRAGELAVAARELRAIGVPASSSTPGPGRRARARRGRRGRAAAARTGAAQDGDVAAAAASRSRAEERGWVKGEGRTL